MFYTDSGEMVDHSTQTPHDESANKQEELDVDGEKTAGSADSVSGESKQGRTVILVNVSRAQRCKSHLGSAPTPIWSGEG